MRGPQWPSVGKDGRQVVTELSTFGHDLDQPGSEEEGSGEWTPTKELSSREEVAALFSTVKRIGVSFPVLTPPPKEPA